MKFNQIIEAEFYFSLHYKDKIYDLTQIKMNKNGKQTKVLKTTLHLTITSYIKQEVGFLFLPLLYLKKNTEMKLTFNPNQY